LLALTAGLFDTVPLAQMPAAEQAVHAAAATIPQEMQARFDTAATLDDGDRQAIVAIARSSLAAFLASPPATPARTPPATP
jgi:F-type H+-transporting ATPase subunit alpha